MGERIQICCTVLPDSSFADCRHSSYLYAEQGLGLSSFPSVTLILKGSLGGMDPGRKLFSDTYSLLQINGAALTWNVFATLEYLCLQHLQQFYRRWWQRLSLFWREMPETKWLSLGFGEYKWKPKRLVPESFDLLQKAQSHAVLLWPAFSAVIGSSDKILGFAAITLTTLF